MRDEPQDYRIAQRAMALQWSADTAFGSSRLADAQAGYRRSLDMMREAGFGHGEAIAHSSLGAVLLCRGRLDEARTHLEAALRIHLYQAEPRFIAIAKSGLGALELEVGHLDEAARLLTEAQLQHQKDGEKPFAIDAMLGLGAVHQAAGRLDEARLTLQQAATDAAAILNERLQGAALATLALLGHEQGEIATALVDVEKALSRLRQAGDRYGEAGALRERAILQLEVADPDALRKDAQTAAKLSEVIGDPHGRGVALALLGVAACARYDAEAAQQHFATAHDLLGDHPLLSAVVSLHEGHFDVIREDLDAARARLAGARAPDGAASRSAAVRVAARLLEQAIERA